MNINQIICGEAAQTLSTFPDCCIDLVVTDPPYLCKYRDRTGRTVRNDANPDAVLPVYKGLYRVLKPDTYCISFYGWNAISEFSNAWSGAGFRTIGHIVWPKRYASGKGHTRYQHEAAFVLVKGCPKMPENPVSSVQKWKYTGNKRHPTEKATSVIAPLVKGFSNTGDLVLDPFAGSGTTAVAAAIHGRDYLGIELEQKYCDVARQRLSLLASQRDIPMAA